MFAVHRFIYRSARAALKRWAVWLAVATSLGISACLPAQATECDLYYSPIPHKNATHAVGSVLQNAIGAADDSVWDGVMAQEAENLPGLLKLVPGAKTALRLHEVRLILGGYQGQSFTSIHARITLQGKPDSLITLSSLLGYVYLQDSVLLSCNEQPSPAFRLAYDHHVTDKNLDKPFFDLKNARMYYGLMMAEENDATQIGYSYFPEEKTFVHLDFDPGSNKQLAVLQHVNSYLRGISNGTIDLKVETVSAYVDFPHNNWALDQEGEAYLSVLNDSSITLDGEGLADLQESFLLFLAEEVLAPAAHTQHGPPALTP